MVVHLPNDVGRSEDMVAFELPTQPELAEALLAIQFPAPIRATALAASRPLAVPPSDSHHSEEFARSNTTPKLEGAGWKYYLTKSVLTIGRDGCGADVAIGSGRLISRHHATISWNNDSRQWMLQCVGRNVVRVDSREYTASDGPIVLKPE